MLSDPEYQPLLDPISLDVMTDPVATADGQVYDREFIQEWFKLQEAHRSPFTSPLTGLELENTNLIPSQKHITLLDKLRNSEVEAADKHPIMVNSEIFVLLDKLLQHESLANLIMKGGLRAPQIVVIGMESHGKSTLLERLIGFSIFPKSGRGVTKLCTRCPIRVHLRRSLVGEISTVGIHDRSTNMPIPGSYAYVPLDRINKVVHEKMNEMMEATPRLFLSSTKEIVVNVAQPYCPNLDVLDLPGIVSGRAITREGFDGDLFKQSTDLIKSIIASDKSFSMFLLVSFPFFFVNFSDTNQLYRNFAGCPGHNSCSRYSSSTISTRVWNYSTDSGCLH